VDQRSADLQRDIANYRDQVDQLRLLRDAHATDAQAQPWQALRQQQGAAQQALQATDALAGELQREREKLRQARGLRDLLLQRLADAEQQQQALATRDAALATATTRHEEALATEARGLQAQATANAALAAARDALALARQEDTRATLQRQAADATARVGELGTQRVCRSGEFFLLACRLCDGGARDNEIFLQGLCTGFAQDQGFAHGDGFLL